MANRPDGDLRRPLLAEEDDWFHTPSVRQIETGEVAWQDEPELLPRRPSASLGRRRAVVVLAVIVAVVLVAAGILIVRAIDGSGGTTATPGSTAQVPTTPAATTPVQTSPHPTGTSGTTTTSTPPVRTAAVLRAGNAGAAVKGLQRALTRLGYAPGAADGSFGPATVQAVIAFQRAHGLPADGIAGAKTIAAINVALASGWIAATDRHWPGATVELHPGQTTVVDPVVLAKGARTAGQA